MIVINFKDPARGLRRTRGDSIVYEKMDTEEFLHLYDGDTLTGVVRRDAIDSIVVDEGMTKCESD